ncbi:hypothetical protein H6769_06765 [Candidatus Peribacteria bacterium]|nr:hypothetical protein [Candidatus Peribacteria bacterium]
MWHHHNHCETGLFLILFRSDFDISYVGSLPIGINTLWIDYLAFDPEIVMLHGQEHIRSSVDHPIIHIVNSPLGGGLLSSRAVHDLPQDEEIRLIARQAWQRHLPYILDIDIELSSPIVTIFSYETQKHIQEMNRANWLVFGFTPIASPQSSSKRSWILPYILIDQFYTLISLSNVVIVR